MFVLLNGFFVSLFLLRFLSYSFFCYYGRASSLKLIVQEALLGAIRSNVGKSMLYFLFFSFLLINLIGNIPLNSIPTMFYSVTLSISLLF